MKHLITAIRILFLALFLFLISQGKMMLWLALFAVSLILAPLFGRLYCGFACPMNTVMIPMDWLAKKLNWQLGKTPKWLHSGHFAWVSLAVSVAATLLAQLVLKKSIPVLLIWLGLSALMTLWYKPAVFHNQLCPFGPLQMFFGRSAKFSHRVDRSSCSGCRLCEKVCPSGAITVQTDRKAWVDPFYCLQCTGCQQVCPKGSIRYAGR